MHSAMAHHGICGGCDEHALLVPLHGDRGGPLRCLLCAGEWNARHTRRQKWGRIIIKAMKMFEKEGGRWGDLDKLKVAASGLLSPNFFPGFEDTIGAEVGDITAELLDETLQLTHPDRHPLERRELAQRVTQELLALKPFVFPAPKPKPRPSDASVWSHAATAVSRNVYPCELCADEVPLFYCHPCRAEWEKRRQVELKREAAKRRERRARRRASQPPAKCAACGSNIAVSRRKDAKFCSPACRQRAHRERVTANRGSAGDPPYNRNEVV
jgi:hypothetical protein